MPKPLIIRPTQKEPKLKPIPKRVLMPRAIVQGCRLTCPHCQKSAVCPRCEDHKKEADAKAKQAEEIIAKLEEYLAKLEQKEVPECDKPKHADVTTRLGSYIEECKKLKTLAESKTDLDKLIEEHDDHDDDSAAQRAPVAPVYERRSPTPSPGEPARGSSGRI